MYFRNKKELHEHLYQESRNYELSPEEALRLNMAARYSLCKPLRGN